MSHMCGCCGGQKWVLGPLELEFQEVGSYPLWVLETKLVSSEGLESTLSQ